MNREAAYKIVTDHIKSKTLINHMLAVEAAMRFYAERLGEDVDKWGLTGLLHDFDWEMNPSLHDHPVAGAPILRELGVEEDIIHAIMCHGDQFGFERVTPLEKGLYACDEITGLITAVALVRPSKSLYDLTASSVKKKWKDKAFAAGANRADIERGAADFDVELWQHVRNIILAMRNIASDLDLAGSLTPAEAVEP